VKNHHRVRCQGLDLQCQIKRFGTPGRVPVQVVPSSVVKPHRPRVRVASRVTSRRLAPASRLSVSLQPNRAGGVLTKQGALAGCTGEASLCPCGQSAGR
jgi:hypothetical protein